MSTAHSQGESLLGVSDVVCRLSSRRTLRVAQFTLRQGEHWCLFGGNGAGSVPGGAICKTHIDHRIAMSFLVLGMAAKNAVSVDDASPIVTSFPIFEGLMTGLGATLSHG